MSRIKLLGLALIRPVVLRRYGNHSVLYDNAKRDDRCRLLVLMPHKKCLYQYQNWQEKQREYPSLEGTMWPVLLFCQINVYYLERCQTWVPNKLLQIPKHRIPMPHKHVVVLLSADKVLYQHRQSQDGYYKRVNRRRKKYQYVEVCPVLTFHVVVDVFGSKRQVCSQYNPNSMNKQKHDDKRDDAIQHVAWAEAAEVAAEHRVNCVYENALGPLRYDHMPYQIQSPVLGVWPAIQVHHRVLEWIVVRR